MSTIIHSAQRAILSRQGLIVAEIVLLSAALVAIYIRVMPAQTIAPPSLRILDFFWRAFSLLRA